MHDSQFFKYDTMAAGKASLKRSQPSYIYSIVGVALVLFILGVMGWVFLNFKEVGNTLKEKIEFKVFLRSANKDTIGQIQQFIASKPYAKEVKYIDKEAARKIWNADNNEDWAKMLDANPLPESINFFVKSQYVNKDSSKLIVDQIAQTFPNQITEIKYEDNLVTTISNKANTVGIICIVIGAILCIIVIVSIDNTIRLAMFSNRFLIKTMQMVGATRGFIVRPMNIRAIINGLISAVLAIALMVTLIGWAEHLEPELKTIRNIQMNLILFGGMVLIGVLISWYSTHRSVMKYLKMKLDDLY